MNERPEIAEKRRPDDRRVRKTRAALKKALTTLLLEKSINAISVKELTDMADINRGTFYLHYKDVYDLLGQSEEELMEGLKTMVNSFSAESVNTDPRRLFKELYTLCKRDADIVRILISENGDLKFLNSMKELLKEKCLHDWSINLRELNSEHFDAHYAFIVGGCLNLLQYWFASGMKESPEELADITGTFINHAGKA